MDRIIEEMQKLCFSNRIPVLGTGKSAALESADPGYRPSDTLPSAKSVVCVGVPVPRGVFQAKERSHEAYWRAASIYYRMIDAVLLRMAQIIEEEGETAVPVFGCFPYDVRGPGDFWGYLSLVRAAEQVGIGKVGKNGLLFNSQYGARLILGGILTTADLPVTTRPNRDEKGCPEGCFVCQDNCPVKAIDRQGRVDRLACIKHSMKSPIFSFFMKTKAFDPSEASLINHVAGVDDHSMYTCIKCVAMCPFPVQGR